MEPEDNNNNNHSNIKNSESPINRQINRYRHALPEVQRSSGHFFFKQVTRQMPEITFVTIGYRVGTIPFELHDFMAVAINTIHYSCELNLKLIMDGDQLWVTSSVGIPTEQLNSLRFRVQQAHINESLLKTQRIMAQFMQQLQNSPKRDDKETLEKLDKQIIKQIRLVFKNPDLDD